MYPNRSIGRRDFLYGLSATLGTVALNAMLQAEERSTAATASRPLAPKPPHHPPRAKACIFLYMEGGPSHLDTFDPKPKLDQLHLSEFSRQDRFASAMARKAPASSFASSIARTARAASATRSHS